jgi:transcriptional regulator with XRE-family HTH domain
MAPGTSASLLDPQALAFRIGARRRSQGLTQRQAAAAIGVSAATLSRIENGRHLPHREPLLKIARWLNVPLGLPGRESSVVGSHAPPPAVSTVESVELLLRADPGLSADDTAALIESFQILYQHLRKQKHSSAA